MAKVIFTTVETVARVYEVNMEELKDLLLNDLNTEIEEPELPEDIEELVDLFVEREGEIYLTPKQEELEENKVTYVEVKE